MGTWRAVGLVVIAGAIRLPTLALPLTEAHSFRQAQTAFPAVIYAAEGIDLLRPQVPVFGPPWVMPFEFPLYQAGASLLIQLGVPMEVALRGLSLAAFLATGLVLWLLLSRHVTQRAALIALAAFLFSPFSLLWARTSMIEYPATLGAVLVVWAVLEWTTGHGKRWFWVAMIAGTSVALVKVTTAVFWLIPALTTRRRTAVAIVAVPMIAATLWTRYADGIKAGNEYASFLVSSNLIDWTVGGDRLDPQTWKSLIDLMPQVVGLLALPFVAAIALRSEIRVWVWMVVAAAGPIVVFTNLYSRHDYYLAAITPSIAALIGGGLDEALRRLEERWRKPVLLLVLALAVYAVRETAWYWAPAYVGGDPDGVMAEVAAIRSQSQPSDLVVLRRDDWSPAAFLYAARRGYALQFGLPAHEPMPGDGLLVSVP